MQDISCAGRCSLTVALPVLSTMGLETAVLPTAVLSTHTMFKDFSFHDLTNNIKPIMDAWEKSGVKFNGIYTGYLGSIEQLDLAIELIDRFGEDHNILVDPCMADHGKFYAGFTEDFAKEMSKLCAKADIIVPNITEACFLLGEEYVGDDYDEDKVKYLLKELTKMGCKKAVITGISLDPSKLGAYAYDSETDTYCSYYSEKLDAKFHGTGDIWASTLFGAMENDKSFEESLKIACEFTAECIRVTLKEKKEDDKYGVNFELALPYLLELLK